MISSPRAPLVFVILITLGAPFAVAELELQSEKEPIELALGFSKTVRFARAVSNVEVWTPEPLDAQFLHTIPVKPNKDLVLFASATGVYWLKAEFEGDPSVHSILVSVPSVRTGESRRVLESQFESERRSGLQPIERDLIIGRTVFINVSFPIGPIFLTDPDTIRFERVSPKSLKVTGLQLASSDLTLCDDFGNPKVKYYFSVEPKP